MSAQSTNREMTNPQSNIVFELLQDQSLDVVSGGAPGLPGLPIGTNINISPWSNRPFDFQWTMVGATGTLPP